MKIRIDSDVYNINKRIRDIDRDYRIVFDTDRDLYEIHNLGQTDSTYCLSIPYKYLDVRVLDLVRQTMSDNIETILAKIDNDNKIQESDARHNSIKFLIDNVFDGR